MTDNFKNFIKIDRQLKQGSYSRNSKIIIFPPEIRIICVLNINLLTYENKYLKNAIKRKMGLKVPISMEEYLKLEPKISKINIDNPNYLLILRSYIEKEKHLNWMNKKWEYLGIEPYLNISEPKMDADEKEKYDERKKQIEYRKEEWKFKNDQYEKFLKMFKIFKIKSSNVLGFTLPEVFDSIINIYTKIYKDDTCYIEDCSYGSNNNQKIDIPYDRLKLKAIKNFDSEKLAKLSPKLYLLDFSITKK